MPETEARQHLSRRLAAVAAQDRGALRDVYDLTSAKLFGICLRILPDREEAEDVLQDVYMTVWNKAATFEPDRASPITWLATIARNRAIDRLRSIGSRPRTSDIEQASEVFDETPDALTHIETNEEAGRLHDCLRQLDERARRAISAAFLDGHTYEELARERGMPLGTMKSIVRRGLIRLRGCLEP